MKDKCEWCGSKSNLRVYTSPFGEEITVCDKCHDSVTHNRCRKCGESTSEEMMINGLCASCLQVEVTEKNREKDRMLYSLDQDIHDIEDGLTMTEADYERWLTFGTPVVTPDQMKRSPELKRLWIVTKLMASGVFDTQVIEDHIEVIEEMLDGCFTRLLKRKCRVVIENDNPEFRKMIRQYEVVDHKEDVYILYIE